MPQQGYGYIDIHAHILPGVDDGARDWDETGRLLRAAAAQGIVRVIATPHFSLRSPAAGDPAAHIEMLREKADRLTRLLRDAQAGREPPAGMPALPANLEISLGQEIFYFGALAGWLSAGKALTLAGSRYVLIEFSPGESPRRLMDAVRSLVSSGFIPVLAHMERYACLRAGGRAEELIRAGACCQINAESLLGHFLDRDARWCRRQVLLGHVHFIATDMHSPAGRPPRLSGAAAWLEKRDHRLADRLLRANPSCVLEDRLL